MKDLTPSEIAANYVVHICLIRGYCQRKEALKFMGKEVNRTTERWLRKAVSKKIKEMKLLDKPYSIHWNRPGFPLGYCLVTTEEKEKIENGIAMKALYEKKQTKIAGRAKEQERIEGFETA